jgi:O-antigen/teichoic acid export membrane protein
MKIKETLKNPLIRGSLILLITFNIFNLLNFVFQFSMARMLPIAEYGTLATLFSLIYITGIFSEPIQTVITKFSVSQKGDGELKNFLKKGLRKSLSVSLIVFICYAIISVPLSFLLKIDYLLLFLNGGMIFAAFLPPITKGVMQGKKMFGSLGTNLMIEGVIKLGFAVGLVYIGWHIYGALTATILGFLFALVVSFFSLRKVFKAKERKAELGDIYNYTRPVFFVLLFLLVFYNIDIILAKMFFEADIAGTYAIASILGKIIFMGTAAISKVMFPLSSSNGNSKENKRKILFNSLGILSLCSIVALAVFFFFSKDLVLFYSGKTIVLSASILPILAIASIFISFANLILLYNLSIGKIKGYLLLAIPVLIEALILWKTSYNLESFSIGFLVSSVIFLIFSLFSLRNNSDKP